MAARSLTDATDPQRLDVLFEPLQIGALTARSRVVVPPHSSAIGNLWGTELEADQAIAYLRRRAQAGVAWTTMPGRISNVLAPGFEPSGLSAVIKTQYRFDNYVERTSRYVDAMHAEGALAATQLTMNGGYPHAPSTRFAQKINAQAPHVITVRELETLIEEYRFSAGQAFRAGVDVLELHLNHEDLTAQFASARTNGRDDEYGGSLENRLRFPLAVLRAAREQLGPDRVLGVRFNGADEMFYDLDEGVEIANAVAATGLVDYFHIVHGSTWGNPSYIQPHFYDLGKWSTNARAYRDALDLPIIYSGLVASPERAAEIVSSGDADMVGMARAHVADPDLLVKAKAGQAGLIRPCIGANDCINRRYVDGLAFGCAVNPHAADERDGDWPAGRTGPREAIVIGGGSSGLEMAALLAEAGTQVTLHEASDALGGQLRSTSQAPSWARYGEYLNWQLDRLTKLGVDVRLNSVFDKTALEQVADGVDVVFATGASERRPEIPGVDLPHVHTAREVLDNKLALEGNVLVIAHEDHLAPASVAETLAASGSQVTMAYQTHVPAQLLGRYSVGAVLGRLDELGVRVEIMTEVTAIHEGKVSARNIYSGREFEIADLDHVVLACGGASESALFEHAQNEGRVEAHILGDAYAPRRIVFGTRQALVLAKSICERAEAKASPVVAAAER